MVDELRAQLVQPGDQHALKEADAGARHGNSVCAQGVHGVALTNWQLGPPPPCMRPTTLTQ